MGLLVVKQGSIPGINFDFYVDEGNGIYEGEKQNEMTDSDFKYIVSCGTREAMEMILRKGGKRGLNMKTNRTQFIEKKAKYKMRVDKTEVLNSETGEIEEWCTLFSNMDLDKIADKKNIAM